MEYEKLEKSMNIIYDYCYANHTTCLKCPAVMDDGGCLIIYISNRIMEESNGK